MRELREALIAFFAEGEMSGMEYASELVDAPDSDAILNARPNLLNQVRDYFDEVWPEGGQVDDWDVLTDVLTAIEATTCRATAEAIAVLRAGEPGKVTT
jgi:hypothetical protein